MKQDEQAVITRILDGDEDLYRILVDRYKEGLYRHCFNFVRDEDLAEDLAQEAFIKAFVKLENYDRVHAFSTWLYKIATNLALEELRRKRPLLLEEEMVRLIVSTQPSSEQLRGYGELHEAIERLPEKQRMAIKLHYFKGKKYDEIAIELQSSVGSVKSWMSRAKKQLKELLS